MVNYELLESQIMNELKETKPSDEKYSHLLKRLSEVQQIKDREEQTKERKEAAEFDRLFKNSKMDAEFERNRIEQEKNEREADIQERRLEIDKENNRQKIKVENSKNYNEYGKIALKGGMAVLVTAVGSAIEETGLLGKAIGNAINVLRHLGN